MVGYCNFTCDFCGYSQNKCEESMSISTFKDVIYKAGLYNIEHGINQLTVIFHGGEPLLWGFENFKKSMEIEDSFKYKHKGFKFINNIQTNGSLINDDWIGFFKINKFNVGISIDGPPEINFHQNNCQAVVVRNIHKLIDSGCNTRVLSVITNAHKKRANDYYDYMIKNGILNIGLCFCVDYDNHTHINNEILTDFLKTLYIRCRQDNFRLHIREIENMINCCKNRINDQSISHCCTFNLRRSCGNYFSINPNGDIIFCDHLGFNEQILGNILINDFFDVKNANILKKELNKTYKSLQNFCSFCEIRDMCGRGCSKHLTKSGKNYFCDTYKEIYKFILDDINQCSYK